MTFFLIEMKFSPPQAKQNLTVLHPMSESCWDSQTSLHDDESTDITAGEELFRNQPPCVTRLSLRWHVSRFFFFFERCRPRAGKSFSTLCSASESRLSLPAACRHAPVAPDCLIGTFQVRGSTSQDRAPRQWYTCSAAAGVAALFFCTLPEVLGVVEESKGRVILRQDRGKSMTNDLAFSWSTVTMCSSYWPISLSIIQSRF